MGGLGVEVSVDRSRMEAVRVAQIRAALEGLNAAATDSSEFLLGYEQGVWRCLELSLWPAGPKVIFFTLNLFSFRLRDCANNMFFFASVLTKETGIGRVFCFFGADELVRRFL